MANKKWGLKGGRNDGKMSSKWDDLLNDALRQSIKRKNDEFEAYAKQGLLNTIDYDGYPRTNMNEVCGICKEQQMKKKALKETFEREGKLFDNAYKLNSMFGKYGIMRGDKDDNEN